MCAYRLFLTDGGWFLLQRIRQFTFQNLAGRVARQRLDDDDALWRP
jgi:hypothetical protein